MENQMMQESLAKTEDVQLEEQTFEIVDDTLFRTVENEAVLLHLNDGNYYSLNETSIHFWEALRDRQPLVPVVDRIIAEYETTREEVIKDLRIFLQELLDYKLIHMS
jgi:Coenzyme PQQ synthesis protein D (PqqD)